MLVVLLVEAHLMEDTLLNIAARGPLNRTAAGRHSRADLASNSGALLERRTLG